MITIREQIVQALMERLKPLTVEPVKRREKYEDVDIFVCIWDGAQDSERDDYGHATHAMDVAVEYVRKDLRPRTQAEAAQHVSRLHGDLVTILFNGPEGHPDPTLGGLAETLFETSMMPFTPDSGMPVIGCMLQIEVRFTTRNGDPFSQ